jgi:hypothetical protein
MVVRDVGSYLCPTSLPHGVDDWTPQSRHITVAGSRRLDATAAPHRRRRDPMLDTTTAPHPRLPPRSRTPRPSTDSSLYPVILSHADLSWDGRHGHATPRPPPRLAPPARICRGPRRQGRAASRHPFRSARPPFPFTGDRRRERLCKGSSKN